MVNEMLFYKLSKVFFILYLFYVGWFNDVFYSVSILPMFFGLSTILFFLLYKLSSKEASLAIPVPAIILIVFLFYALLTGLFVASDKGYLLNSLFTFSHKIILMIYIINISMIENSNKFFIKTWVLYSIVYAITMLFWGYENIGGRLLLSINSNPNTDALMLLMGVFCCFALLKYNKLNQMLLSLGLIAIFSYTILLTGSRKTVLALLFLIVFWILIVLKKYWQNYSLKKKIVLSSVVTMIYVPLIIKYLPTIKETSFFNRFQGELTVAADPARSMMYSEAMDLLAKNPLIGVGFDHFRFYSIFNTYSHSTYAELLSTTGLIGTTIYLLSYLIIIINLGLLYLRNKENSISTKALEYLLFMIILLLLGTGIIHFYSIRDYIIIAIIISFYFVEKRKSEPKNFGRKVYS